MSKTEKLAKELYEGLKDQFGVELKEYWAEYKNNFKKYAESVAELQIKIVNEERLTTSISVLQDILDVGIPALITELRYKIEESSLSKVQEGIKVFFTFALAFALAFVLSAGKKYLESAEIESLRNLREHI